MEAVQKTPEREAFYKKIDGENLSALWNVMGDLITPEPRSPGFSSTRTRRVASLAVISLPASVM